MRPYAAIVATGLLVFASCGDDDDAARPPTTAPLRPAGEVIAEQAIDGALDVGTSATMGELTVTVSEMTAAPDDGGFRLAVTMRVENPTDETQSAPEVSVICTGNPDGGGYQVESTMQAGEELPPGTFVDATQYLLLPGDARITGESVPPCNEPAVVEVSGVGAFAGEVPAASWLIPPDVIPTP